MSLQGSIIEFLRSIQNLSLPSFFFTKTIAEVHGLLECLMAPNPTFLSREP